jgi:hypothetical protein
MIIYAAPFLPLVITGLVPVIHGLGPVAGKDVDGRTKSTKSGHDE